MKGEQLKVAKNAIKKIAEKDGVSVEYVKDQIMFAMMSSFSSEDPEIKNFWDQIPHEGAFPTTEEFILFISKYITQEKDQ